MLVLPAHVRVHGRRRPAGQGLEEPVEHPVLLGEVRRGRYVARHDLLRAEVEHRGPVGLGAGDLELGDVGAELLPRPLGAEVPRDDVLERAPHEPPVGAVPAAGAPAAYPHRMPISRIILSTVLSATTAPSSARRHMAICRCPQPLAVRENISAAASRSSGLVGLRGCASA